MGVSRVGNNQLTRQVLNNIQRQLAAQEELFQQVSSSKRIQKPSDDPLGTGKAMGFRAELVRRNNQEQTVDAGDMWTNITNVALESAGDVWQRVNEIAISAADGTKSANDLAALGEEVEQLLQHMVQVGNTKNRGLYIFSGSRTDSQAFSTEIDEATGRITGVFYEGNTSEKQMKTNDDRAVSVGALGSNGGDSNKRGVFIDGNEGVNVFNTMIDLRNKLLDNDKTGISGEGGILEEIERGSSSIIGAQVRIGGAQESLDLDRKMLTDQTASVSEALSRVEDADMAQAILDLNNIQNVYEAALAASGRILQRGLIEYI